jgi:N-acetylmuramoyl-L-alanine amidase
VTRAAADASNRVVMEPYGLGAAGLQPPTPRPAIRPEVLAAQSFKPLIVIDPGHGGHDTGARKNGTVEKHVVLAFSKVLRDKLLATGRYRVKMTRDTDVFITLDGRRRFAEKHKAALFIAVHADYASRSGAKGATIYSLRDSVAERLKRSAMGEVKSAVLSKKELADVKKSGGNTKMVHRILSDFAVREVKTNKQRTSIFSHSVIKTMGTATDLRNQPDRSAAFRVLKTAKVPSVLIELAYVTNKRDAKRLKSDHWRNKVAESIRAAVDNFFTKARLPL